MAHITKLRRIGNSVMIALPQALLDAMSLKVGQMVVISVDNGRLAIEAQRRRRYVLADLLAQCNPTARRSAKGRDWLDASTVGRELL